MEFFLIKVAGLCSYFTTPMGESFFKFCGKILRFLDKFLSVTSKELKIEINIQMERRKVIYDSRRFSQPQINLQHLLLIYQRWIKVYIWPNFAPVISAILTFPWGRSLSYTIFPINSSNLTYFRPISPFRPPENIRKLLVWGLT